MLSTRLSILRVVQHSCRRAFHRPESTLHSTADSAGPVGPHKTAAEGVPTPDDGKLPAREPLVKNFFVGMVDKELLGYPEPIARDALITLKNEILPIKDFFEENVDGRSIDAARTIPPAVLQELRDLGLFRSTAPLAYDGKGWGWTESIFAAETETKSPEVALGLSGHRVVIDLLLEKGSPEQQQRFLGKMASGDLVGTEAIYEFDAPQDDFFNTKAEYDAAADLYILNGRKSFVVILDGATASANQLFLVIAQTRAAHVKGADGRGTSIFLVDSTAPGVRLGDQHITFGCRGLPMRHVHFDGVQLTADAVVGLPHESTEIADVVLRASRLRGAGIAVGVAKNALNQLAQFCLQSKHCSVELKDMEVMKQHVSKAMCSVYAMESMLYMTAGILDEFRAPDVALEAAMVKYYSVTRLFQLAATYVDVIGPKALHAGEFTEALFRQAAQLNSFGETNDTMRFYIALMGLHHAGARTQETISKSRNPLFHPSHIMSKFLDTSNIDNPKTKLGLGAKLHPSLEPAAQAIEHSVARLQMCVELLLTRYGSEVSNQHAELARLAEMGTLIYSMFCSASRASRSYCIGLPLADYELLTASSVCVHGRDEVYNIAKQVFNGKYVNNDENLERLATQVMKGGYFTAHPLTFNY